MSEMIATVPVAQDHGNQCLITPRWFVNRSEYRPQAGHFQLLINGDAAFSSVFAAIAAAKKSVSIICWGFQPSMYFVRGEYGGLMRIGQLLEKKAEEGVEVRVLCWALDVTYGVPFFLDPFGLTTRHVNVTGGMYKVPFSDEKVGLGESNMPGRFDQRDQDRPRTSTDGQQDYDIWWYQNYDEGQEAEDVRGKRKRAKAGDTKAKHLHFRSRGFSTWDRVKIGFKRHEDADLSLMTRVVLGGLPSHHQKMVLVDYEDPELAVGFVMGHNMLDEYWDDDRHTAQRHTIRSKKPDPHPDRGPNGWLPRHDFSSRITGPMVGDLFHNFDSAWKAETGDALPKPQAPFETYAPRAYGPSRPVAGQILRTQPQHGVEDIKRCYLQAVNNASQYIYIENQYFRWPVLAEKIKDCAAQQTACGRKPEAHDPLYLFVITNASDDGVGAGTVNTYRMLESLGRADTIPGVARDERADAIGEKLKQVRAENAALYRERQQIQETYPGSSERSREIDRRLEANEAREKELKDQLDKTKNTNIAISQEDPPGLKTHIATLVAPDTKEGEPWVEVYIHAKLMIIDDAFLTIGSANINTRSMETDSELNIAVDCCEEAREAREKLWKSHAGDDGVQSTLKDTFKAWDGVMTKNKTERKADRSPISPLVEFHRDSPKRSNLD